MKICAVAGLVMVAAGAAAAQEVMFGLSNPLSPVLRRLDPATGNTLESHAVTGHEALFGGLAAMGGALYSVDGFNDPNPDRLFSINPASGAGTVIGPTGFNWNFRCLAEDVVRGVVFGVTDNRLFTLDRLTGAATLVAEISAPMNLDQATAMAVNRLGRAYLTDIGNTDLFSLDLTTGQATWIASVGTSGNWFEDLAFDAAGTLWGCRLNGGVYTIDPATAQQTFRFGGSYNGLVFVGGTSCYANCDESTGTPALNVNDFVCFQARFAAGDPYADCDATGNLNVNDFVCFQQRFAAGCP